MFSAKASTLLREHHVKIDLSKRDRDLFTPVATGIQISVCKLCHMCDHTTEFCPLQLKNKVNHQELIVWEMMIVAISTADQNIFRTVKEFVITLIALEGVKNAPVLSHMFAPSAVRKDIHMFFVGNAHQQRFHPIKHLRLTKKHQRHLAKCD